MFKTCGREDLALPTVTTLILGGASGHESRLVDGRADLALGRHDGDHLDLGSSDRRRPRATRVWVGADGG